MCDLAAMYFRDFVTGVLQGELLCHMLLTGSVLFSFICSVCALFSDAVVKLPEFVNQLRLKGDLGISHYSYITSTISSFCFRKMSFTRPVGMRVILKVTVCLTVLLLILTPKVTDAKPAKFFPLSCRKCNAITASQPWESRQVCNDCGTMYGWEYEHCCLCDFAFYERCRSATR